MYLMASMCDGNSCGELAQCFFTPFTGTYRTCKLSTGVLVMYIVCIPWTLMSLTRYYSSDYGDHEQKKIKNSIACHTIQYIKLR